MENQASTPGRCEEVGLKELESRLQQVLDHVAGACRKVGRSPDEVELIAISKKHPAKCIEMFAKAGQIAFGESYVQEALEKQQLLASLASRIQWHFVGGLQSNKAKLVTGNFSLIHSVDSLKLAQKISAKAVASHQRQPVLLQVNIAAEKQKSGVETDGVFPIAQAMQALEGIELMGLMILPPYCENPEEARPYFKMLREMKRRLDKEWQRPLPHLSMGMSHDYVQAVEEGATLIRVGTVLFGPRPY
jgi:hypothetical protein